MVSLPDTLVIKKEETWVPDAIDRVEFAAPCTARMRESKSKCTVLLFDSGVMIVIGCRTKAAALRNAEDGAHSMCMLEEYKYNHNGEAAMRD
jgi:TATA-box binding protein (TBP) (component of TFIID and TFIIIB)